MKRIVLPDVHSLLASEADQAAAGLAGLPHRLHQHQLATYLALCDGSAPVV